MSTPRRQTVAIPGQRRAMARERTKCLRCNGRGTYRSARSGAVVTCPVCKGSKREPGR